MRLMKETYHFNVVLFAPFANPGANAASWTALSNYVYIGVENYLSGEEIKAQNFSVSWCQTQYQSSVNSYTSLGMPSKSWFSPNILRTPSAAPAGDAQELLPTNGIRPSMRAAEPL